MFFWILGFCSTQLVKMLFLLGHLIILLGIRVMEFFFSSVGYQNCGISLFAFPFDSFSYYIVENLEKDVFFFCFLMLV